jgi:hypothetical protein
MDEPDETPVKVENSYHRYVANRIPWFVRMMWIGYWCFAIYYTLRYLFPDLQLELLHTR